MKLNAEISGHKHEIEIKRENENVYAKIDGREYELTVAQPETDMFMFNHAGRVYEISVSPDAGTPGTSNVRVGPDEFSVRITDPKRLSSVAGLDASADGPAEIRTAMPGKVVRLLVEVGATVEKGDGVVVVEAMKMQNELKAPKNGTIKEIRVAEGSTVTAGETLATVV